MMEFVDDKRHYVNSPRLKLKKHDNQSDGKVCGILI